jgi:putative transcriptional regulator
MSDPAIEKEIGRRFKELRLWRNVTQESIAERAMISLNRIKVLERGKAKLETVIAVLRELDALDRLDNLIPGPGITPIQLDELQCRKRQRASKRSEKNDSPSP